MIFKYLEFYEGFAISLGLIMSIGMQNSFILKQGLLKNHVTAVIITCTICEAILITLGVSGFGTIWSSNDLAKIIAQVIGCLYLIGYGTKCFINAFNKNSLRVSDNEKSISLSKSIATAIAVSLLNPHAFLDSCIFLSGVATNIKAEHQKYFILGAVTASFLWFITIGYGARFLRKFFAKPISWKILDVIIGIIMYLTAIHIFIKS